MGTAQELSEHELAEFNKSVEEFASLQLAKFQSNDFRGRKLFQVNLNFLAVSRAILENDEEETEELK